MGRRIIGMGFWSREQIFTSGIWNLSICIPFPSHESAERCRDLSSTLTFQTLNPTSLHHTPVPESIRGSFPYCIHPTKSEASKTVPRQAPLVPKPTIWTAHHTPHSHKHSTPPIAPPTSHTTSFPPYHSPRLYSPIPVQNSVNHTIPPSYSTTSRPS